MNSNDCRIEPNVRRASSLLRAFLSAAILLVANPSRVLANTAVPGVLIFFGMGATSQGAIWFLLAMVTCIMTEGAILKWRCPRIPHPYGLSCLINIASLLIGTPIGLLTAIALGELFVIATGASIGIECALVYYWLRKKSYVIDDPSLRNRAVTSVFWGNLLSNALLVGLLFVMVKVFPILPSAAMTFEKISATIGK